MSTKTLPMGISGSKQENLSPLRRKKMENIMSGNKLGVTTIGFKSHALSPMEFSNPEKMDCDDPPKDRSAPPPRSSFFTRKISDPQHRSQDSSHSYGSLPRKRRNEEAFESTQGSLKRQCTPNTRRAKSNEASAGPFRQRVNTADVMQLKQENTRLNEQVKQLQHELTQMASENNTKTLQIAEIQSRLDQIPNLENQLRMCQSQITRAKESLIDTLKQISMFERKERELKLIQDNKRIGRVAIISEGFQPTEVWEDGNLFEDVKRRKAELNKEKESILARRKEMKQQLNATRSARNSRRDSNSATEFERPAEPVLDNLAIELEIVARRLETNKKALSSVNDEEIVLEYKKKQHVKFIRLMREEKRSRFARNTILSDKYLLLNLIGKGGFSEVHRAYDLENHRYVACKIHQLNQHWSEDRKMSYTKHATREYDIHKTLDHPRIVRLYDVFGIDVNSFATVLEYCDGMDLDLYLKIHRVLKENEARSIVVQLIEGLQYLAEQPNPIIHYDLKPGNILYKDGSIKLTDFGLAKIMNQDETQMELTSQGAGTYWYLPPECFITKHTPMISPKVDVWSVGIVFYQMLYGKRPFGDEETQDAVLTNGTILKARQVEFPSSPKVSSDAKDLMACCLAYDHVQRPTPSQLMRHHYFAKIRK